jgi:hypothetical protein
MNYIINLIKRACGRSLVPSPGPVNGLMKKGIGMLFWAVQAQTKCPIAECSFAGYEKKLLIVIGLSL